MAKESIATASNFSQSHVDAVVKYTTMVIPGECELPANVVAYTVDNVEGDALIVTKLSGKVPAGTAVLLVNTTNAQKTQIFDAAGRSLKSMQKGLNIVNGVKVMVK